MEIYFILITICITCSFFSRKKYYLIIFISMGILAALRASTVGTDTFMYNGIYNGVNSDQFSWEYYDKTLTEIGNRILMVIACYIFDNSQGYIAISSIIMFSMFSVFFYKCSTNKYKFVLPMLFIGLNYYAFSMNGMRQSIGISIGLFSYLYIKKRLYVKSCIPILIGSLFHLSTLLFAAYIPMIILLRKIKNIYKNNVKCLIVFCLIEVVGIYYMYHLFLGNALILGEKYAEYAVNQFSYATGGGLSMIAICIIICTVCYLMEKNNDEALILSFYTMQYVIFSVATSMMMAIIYRVTVMFYPFVFLLVYNYISSQNNQMLKVFLLVVCILMSFLNLYYHMPEDVIPYRVFFEV